MRQFLCWFDTSVFRSSKNRTLSVQQRFLSHEKGRRETQRESGDDFAVKFWLLCLIGMP
jgi:hypothetical protein